MPQRYCKTLYKVVDNKSAKLLVEIMEVVILEKPELGGRKTDNSVSAILSNWAGTSITATLLISVISGKLTEAAKLAESIINLFQLSDFRKQFIIALNNKGVYPNFQKTVSRSCEDSIELF